MRLITLILGLILTGILCSYFKLSCDISQTAFKLLALYAIALDIWKK